MCPRLLHTTVCWDEVQRLFIVWGGMNGYLSLSRSQMRKDNLHRFGIRIMGNRWCKRHRTPLGASILLLFLYTWIDGQIHHGFTGAGPWELQSVKVALSVSAFHPLEPARVWMLSVKSETWLSPWLMYSSEAALFPCFRSQTLSSSLQWRTGSHWRKVI